MRLKSFCWLLNFSCEGAIIILTKFGPTLNLIAFNDRVTTFCTSYVSESWVLWFSCVVRQCGIKWHNKWDVQAHHLIDWSLNRWPLWKKCAKIFNLCDCMKLAPHENCTSYGLFYVHAHLKTNAQDLYRWSICQTG